MTDIERYDERSANILSGGKRVSDAERDMVAGALGRAFGKGYISHETFEARHALAMAARSQHDLERLTMDLPMPPVGPGRIAASLAKWVTPLVASLLVAIAGPIWLYEVTGTNLCAGSGAGTYCWTQHSGLQLAGIWAMVITGLAGAALTVLTFVLSYLKDRS